MSQILTRLTPADSRALERLMTIFPSITCRRVDGGYVFSGEYEGLHAETEGFPRINGQVVEALIKVMSALMEKDAAENPFRHTN